MRKSSGVVMSCRKKCGKCNECSAEQGPRGFRGSPGPTGPTGPAGVPGTPAQNFPDTDFFEGSGPITEYISGSYYDDNNSEIFGVGDIISFRKSTLVLNPINKDGDGTFVLPLPGKYQINWQIPLNELTPAQILAGEHVQITLTTQLVDDGPFVPVADGSSGRDVNLSQLTGSVIVLTSFANQKFRLENTSTVSISPLNGPVNQPNDRTISIIDLLGLRTDAYANAVNYQQQVVRGFTIEPPLLPSDPVIFDTPGQFVNIQGSTPLTNFRVLNRNRLDPAGRIISIPAGDFLVRVVLKGFFNLPLRLDSQIYIMAVRGLETVAIASSNGETLNATFIKAGASQNGDIQTIFLGAILHDLQEGDQILVKNGTRFNYTLFSDSGPNAVIRISSTP